MFIITHSTQFCYKTPCVCIDYMLRPIAAFTITSVCCISLHWPVLHVGSPLDWYVYVMSLSGNLKEKGQSQVKIKSKAIPVTGLGGL
jgi:hypothetical protein